VKRASLADETFEMLMFMRGNKHHVTIICDFFKSLINALTQIQALPLMSVWHEICQSRRETAFIRLEAVA
jgi:hypothetical protein